MRSGGCRCRCRARRSAVSSSHVRYPPFAASSVATDHHDFALLGELDRIAEQVHQYLAQAGHVADRWPAGRPGRAIRPGRALFRAAGAANRSNAPSTHSRRSKRLVSSSSLPASILEKSRMSLMMVSRASLLVRIVSAKSRCSSSRVVLQQQPGHADDGVHGRADFVAHVGQESALRFVSGNCGLPGDAQICV